MARKFIKRKSAVKLSPITGSIVDTTNITDKNSNTYSARIFEEMLTIATNASMPVGSGVDFFGTTPPENYMFADGSEISRTEYSELFSIIGTTYGAGDGSTTFNLPDKRCRVSAMLKEGDNEWGTLGQQKGSSWSNYTPSGTISGTALTVAQLPNVTGSFGLAVPGNHGAYCSGVFSGCTQATGLNLSATQTSGSNLSLWGYKINFGNNQTHTHSFTGTQGSINVQQPTIVCNYIIKVKSDDISAFEIVSEMLGGAY